ncbi:uncharacterized protein LDX57_007327 [Aspergillus melleus]|uniref:uncharacterized protein n=1 Tax=Aspergillus melleus TaxID=138277 RepID=UPI001E8DE6B2|nr:uncharacterized protein LDX57_007327 [Aspergillus melleus]KAH8429655.1 hypothetical protein LDX57_007327 [Aspergillus melleus]
MKLNLIAISLFAGAALSKTIRQDETCSDLTKLTGDLDNTCQYLHDQQALVAESHGLIEAYTQRRSAPLTVGEAAAIALGCYRHFEVLFDDIFALADGRVSESVVSEVTHQREQLQNQITKLKQVSSDDEKSSQPADIAELAQLIELMAEKADEARNKHKSSGILNQCSTSDTVVKRQLLGLTSAIQALTNLLQGGVSASP